MKDKILSRALQVQDEKCAKAFSDPLRRRVVLRLALQELSVGDLARAEGIDLKRMHYHVTALANLGLIAPSGERRRAGRAIKTYRSASDAFFVRDGLAPRSAGDELSTALRRALGLARERANSGMIYFNEGGQPRMRAVPTAAGGGAVTSEAWELLELSKTQAEQLVKEISRCLQLRSDGQRRGGKTRYLVHFAIAPTGSTTA